MIKTALIGDVVKFDGQLCKVVGFKSIACELHIVLEYKGKTGAVPVHSVKWNGKQFVCVL